MRLLTDENFNGAILRGLVRRLPELDIIRVQDVGLFTNLALKGQGLKAQSF